MIVQTHNLSLSLSLKKKGNKILTKVDANYEIFFGLSQKKKKKDFYRENHEVEQKYFTALVELTAWQWMSTGLDS